MSEASIGRRPGGNTFGKSYQDANLENPLHIAVHNGHTDAAVVLASAYPAWKKEQNRQRRTPEDLASEEMKRALQNCAVPMLGEDLDTFEAEDEYAPIELAITRSFAGMSGTWAAPGLCSFVAGSSSGALGHIFLVEKELNQHPALMMDLSVINEGETFREDDGVSESADGVPRSSSSLAGSTHNLEQEAGGPLRMDNLEPTDKNNQTISWWALMARESKAVSLGQRLMQVPPEAQLGRGSYGVVWRAAERTSGTTYAVKNIETRSRGGVSAVATREFEMAAHIRIHPHRCIVQLFHVQHFSEVGLYCLVMEFCSGGDLLDRIKEGRGRRGAYTMPTDARRWIGQIFLALEHLHLKMFTMIRDLKPENVVLNDKGYAKLTDFGVGRFGAESTGAWTFGCPPGSPGYISPEVIREEKYTFTADLYSYGVLMWVLLTGGVTNTNPGDPRPPLRTPGARDFKAFYDDWRLLKSAIETPAKNNANPTPADAKDLLLKLLTRQPNSRPKHQEIRDSEIMVNLKLPPKGAKRYALDAWMEA